MTSARQTRRRALLLGALAAAPALAATWVMHVGSPRIPFAPTALADRVIRLTPGDVSTAAIEHLHHAAQQLLVAFDVALFVAIGAVIATAVNRASWAGAAWAMTTLLAALAAPVDPSLPGALAAATVAGALFGVALRSLLKPSVTPPADVTRRRTLVVLGTGTAGMLVAAHPLGRPVGWLAGRPRRLNAGAPQRAPVARRPAFPAIAGLAPEITPVGDHYVVDIDVNDPVVDGPSWRLRVSGLVREPLELSFGDLQREFSLAEEIAVLTCISNEVGGPLVGCSRWEGVLLSDLLARSKPRAGADTLVVRCADGYSAGLPLEAATHRSALLAIAQDGESLSRDHGFPCRLCLPALYGMLNPKWVNAIELADGRYVGYWAQQGWSPTAVVGTESRIDTPRRARAGSAIWIAGVAWAGVRGIRRVEVSTDRGASWQDAELHRPLSPWAWTQWGHRWTPARPGSYHVLCRATDGGGALQAATRRAPFPSGAAGYHEVEIAVT